MITIEHNGAQLRVAELGGELRGYRDAAGTEYLWSGDPAVWKGVSPVLFPAIGALKDGGATIEGVRYPVPRHGFARELPFRVSEQGDDFITLTLTETAETKRLYPFDFALNVTHRLCADGFETRFTVENHTGRDMPFLIGGHPAFACPVGGEGCFEDYVLRFEKPEDGHVSLCDLATHLVDRIAPAPLEADMRTLPLRHADYDRVDTFIFDGLNSRSVDLVHRETGHGIRLSFDMPVLAVWTMPGKNAPYVCLEPWTGCATQTIEGDDFRRKKGMQQLSAGPLPVLNRLLRRRPSLRSHGNNLTPSVFLTAAQLQQFFFLHAPHQPLGRLMGYFQKILQVGHSSLSVLQAKAQAVRLHSGQPQGHQVPVSVTQNGMGQD